jgi:hypothetical protein
VYREWVIGSFRCPDRRADLMGRISGVIVHTKHDARRFAEYTCIYGWG